MLDLCHSAVRLCAKSELDLDQGFETGVEVRNTEVDELGKFGEKLFVELFVCLFSHFGFSLRPRQFGHILVWFLDQFLHLGAHGIVVKEFVVALLDAFVDVWKICAEAGDGFQDGGAVKRFW